MESVDDKELCAPQAEACYDDLACATLLACYEECGYWGPCMAECNEIVIGGVECVLLCLLLGASAVAAVRALAKSHTRSHLPVRLFGHASLT